MASAYPSRLLVAPSSQAASPRAASSRHMPRSSRASRADTSPTTSRTTARWSQSSSQLSESSTQRVATTAATTGTTFSMASSVVAVGAPARDVLAPRLPQARSTTREPLAGWQWQQFTHAQVGEAQNSRCPQEAQPAWCRHVEGRGARRSRTDAQQRLRERCAASAAALLERASCWRRAGVVLVVYKYKSKS
eukprot:6729943-Prymnesium_polylepis.1